MGRRTNEELRRMEEVVGSYLSKAESPHDAWSYFIKDHLVSGTEFPTYVVGVSDFVELYEKQCGKVI